MRHCIDAVTAIQWLFIIGMNGRELFSLKKLQMAVGCAVFTHLAEDCTFFTRKEILRIFKRYRALAPDRVPQHMKNDKPKLYKIPAIEVETMPELRENPFCERICQVFSEDGSGDMSFDDFLDMFSVFSEAAPRDIKCVYAFRIYDFDGDSFLNRIDLERTLRCLTRNELSGDEVIEEADLDDDRMLSYIEFEHVISRSPDFLNTFHIRI